MMSTFNTVCLIATVVGALLYIIFYFLEKKFSRNKSGSKSDYFDELHDSVDSQGNFQL